MAELHVFDPEGDVLLILDRCLPEDDLVESVDEEKRESVPEGSFVLERRGPWVEYKAPPPSDIPEAEVDGITKLESSASAFLASQETKPRVKKVQMRASSRHLILASPIFRISLGSSTYPEGRILQIECNLAVPLPD